MKRELKIYPNSVIDADRFFLLMAVGCLETYIKGYITTDELHSFIFEPASLHTAKEIGVSDFILRFIEENFYYEDYIDSPDGGEEYVKKIAQEFVDKAYNYLKILSEKSNSETDGWNWFIDPSE